MKYLILYSFIFFNVFLFKAQSIDSLKQVYKEAKEDTNKVNVLIELCQQYKFVDHPTRYDYAEKALALSLKLNYRKGIMLSNIALTASYDDMGKYNEAIASLKKALEICLKTPNEKLTLASIHNEFGNSYYRKGDYHNALSSYLKSLALYEELKKTKKTADVLFNMGLVYYQMLEHKRACDYTIQVINIYKQFQDTLGISSAISQLGYIYTSLREFEKALICFKQSLGYTDNLVNKLYSMYNLKGIGGVYRETENHVEALLYYKKALEIAKQLNDEQNIAFCIGNIGYQLASLGKYNESIELIMQSINLYKKLGSKNLTKESYYDIAEVFEKKGDYKESVEYYKLFIELNDSIYNEESSEQINNLTAKYESEKKEKEIALLNADNIAKQKDKEILSAKVNEKNSLIIATIITSLLLIFSVLLYYSRQQLKAKNEKVLFEKKEVLLQLEKQKMEDDLLHAKQLLDNYTENLIDKSKAIEELYVEIEKLKGLKSTEIYNEKIDNLDDLSNATILTNDDWEKFKELFEQVYKGFFTRLRDKYANLSKAEIRLISLMKLNLDTKQMANMLGVSPSTITMTKYRLRKKINLAEKEDIDLIIQSL